MQESGEGASVVKTPDVREMASYPADCNLFLKKERAVLVFVTTWQRGSGIPRCVGNCGKEGRG